MDADDSPSADMLPCPLFIKLLCLERKRAERSGRGFVLMLVDATDLLRGRDRIDVAENIKIALSQSTRDSDIKGWYKENSVIGVIFTETPRADKSVPQMLFSRANHALREILTEGQFKQIAVSVHAFPDDVGGDRPGSTVRTVLYPDEARELESKRIPLLVKRSVDVFVASLAIFLLAPLLILIALAVRLNSPGPAIFRQKRVGQYGKPFTFLKFRSMHTAADDGIHEAYIKQFISNKMDGAEPGEDGTVYKLKADPRVTRIGRFLRRTSLDELPQLFNVVAGHMSLVGPRPPVTYELEEYDAWHRRRLAVKPGITGLWQVEGRSRVKFDDMVRMDLEYARAWSLRLDLKILLRTPRAVVSGDGAY